MALYHEENFSLSEIAEEFGVSRQAVHDTLKKAEQALGEYEAKLGLVARLLRSKKAVADIDEKIDRLLFDLTKGEEPGSEANSPNAAENCRAGNFRENRAQLVAKLEEIKNIINDLE